MTRIYSTVFLVAASIIGITAKSTEGEEVAFYYNKIVFEYVEQTNSGITFGGDSTLPALPADFFAPESEPFAGEILLKGKKILQNVVLERTAGAIFDPPSAPQDIPLEMVELNLGSIQPITVTYSDGLTEQWDLTINLNPNEESGGLLRVTHNVPGEPDGGAILPQDSFFDIFAEVTFTPATGDGGRRLRSFTLSTERYPLRPTLSGLIGTTALPAARTGTSFPAPMRRPRCRSFSSMAADWIYRCV